MYNAPNHYYGNQYPVPDMLGGYKQPYQMPNVQKPSSDIIWVQGETGAKGYPVAPNTTIVLWDAESPTIYVKSADNTGIPTMRILEFTEKTENGKMPSEKGLEGKFVTVEMFEQFKQEIKSQMDNLRGEE